MTAHGPDRSTAPDPSARLAPGADEPWWTLSMRLRAYSTARRGRPPGAAGCRTGRAGRRAARPGRRLHPRLDRDGPRRRGDALLRLFALMAEAVAARVDRLPAKLLVEHLRIAGVSPLPATPAQVLLRLTATASAGGEFRSRRASRPGRPARAAPKW